MLEADKASAPGFVLKIANFNNLNQYNYKYTYNTLQLHTTT